MRSRISGRTLLPAALAAATVTAMAAPAAAQQAPPPAPENYTADDCAQALNVLSYFKLLPNQPDVARALCSMNKANQQNEYQPNEYTDEINSKYTTDTGKAVEENKLLGLPVEWPKSLTVHVPTFNDHWYTYTSKQG